ncbi:uncharacterized protein TNIN_455981 [Trichonephila inaurata madagascariensis]|uniref:Uncharacterized protein n=1 Tax=Trichonephila inaurata madagascariensis TaxID=2747483 RepID=A0A8X6XJC7_9ARAC|nr:uncharacterized protein TNIN_455981 [Trichonephila inaurata madagascariensis]
MRNEHLASDEDKVAAVICTVALVISISVNVECQSDKNDKGHLPVEVFFSPRKDPSESAGNLLQSENKAIELKIQSDANNKGKIDLTIASTKEVQEKGEESVNRYSPQYNAESDRVSDDSAETSKDDISPDKNFETARQDPGALYNPSEFADIIPFDAMRQFYEHPQPFIIGRNQFSPLQNLRHLEENLAKEVIPRALGQGLIAARNVNNEAPFGMVMTHPLYSSGLDAGPQYHADPQSVRGVPYAPQPYYNTVPVADAPQQIQIVQNVPVQQYAQRSPEISQQHLPYGSSSPEYNPSAYQVPHPPQTVRTQVGIMVRDPGYNSQLNLQNPLPEKSAINHAEGRPVYNHHHHPRLQNHPEANIRSHYSPLRSNQEGADQSHQKLHDNREVSHLYARPLQNRPQQLRNEELDRHLYYTPVRGRDQLQSNHPAYASSEIRRPVDDSHLHRARIIPQREYREANPIYSGRGLQMHDALQSRIPTSRPEVKQVPHYALVPQHALPKYLQNPVYRESQQSSERNVPQYTAPKYQQTPVYHERQQSSERNLPQDYRPLVRDIGDHQVHHSSSGSHEIPRPNNHQYHSAARDEHIPRTYQSLPIGAGAREAPDSQPNSRHRLSHASQTSYHPEADSSRDLKENDLSPVERHKPLGKVYSVPQYSIHSRESQQQAEIAVPKEEDSQPAMPKRKRKYKLSEVDPHKKEYKKRKSLKVDNEEMEAHSSHQYIIKIG